MLNKQIYGLVNTIVSNLTEGQTNLISSETDFVSLGTTIVSGTSTVSCNAFFTQLVDIIGKTVIDERAYKRNKRNILVEPYEYGCILQKISYKLQNAQTSSEIGTVENPFGDYLKGGIIAKYFERTLPMYSYTDAILNSQIKGAFKSSTDMAAFIDGIYMRMANAYEVACEQLERTTINKYIKDVVNGTTATNYSKRVRHLVTEYNALHTGATVTSATAMESPNFLKWCFVELRKVKNMLTEMTALYNDGTVERFTNEDSLVFDLSSDMYLSYMAYFENSSYNADLIKLPKFNEVTLWENSSKPYEIQTDEDEFIHVIGVMRDEYAVFGTMDNLRTVSIVDEWNDRVNIKQTATPSYVNDNSHNFVVFLLD